MKKNTKLIAESKHQAKLVGDIFYELIKNGYINTRKLESGLSFVEVVLPLVKKYEKKLIKEFTSYIASLPGKN